VSGGRIFEIDGEFFEEFVLVPVGRQIDAVLE